MSPEFECEDCGTLTIRTLFVHFPGENLCPACYGRPFDERKYDDDPETDVEGD